MVFGKRSGCACLGAPALSWGVCRLPTADRVKYLGLRLESEGGWAAQEAAGAANGWAALHHWLPVLRSHCLNAATKLLVLRSRIAPCMTYGMDLWRPAKQGAHMTAVLSRAAKLISGIHRAASHTAFFKARCPFFKAPVNQDVMLAALYILSADDHCRMAHARQYARQAASAAVAAIYAHNDPCSPDFRVGLSAAYAPNYMGAAVWQGLRTLDAWCEYARMCHETALSHGVRYTSAPARAAPDMVGEVVNTIAKTSGLGSVRWRLCAGACGSRRMGCVGAPAHQLAIHASGGLQTFVTPRHVNTFGPQRSDRLTLLRRRRLRTRLCPCVRRVRRIWSGIIVLTLGSQLSPLRVISATIPSSPRVRILVLLLGLMRLGGTDGATLGICCLNASVSPALTDLWHLPSSGMTLSGCVLGRTTRRRCC